MVIMKKNTVFVSLRLSLGSDERFYTMTKISYLAPFCCRHSFTVKHLFKMLCTQRFVLVFHIRVAPLGTSL